MEERQEPEGTGEPVTERARIAGVEAGVAAGLVAPTDALPRPRHDLQDPGAARAIPDGAASSASAAPGATMASYGLPDWTDPPTLQVPRVLLNLEHEAALGRGGPQPPPPGGPVWRERQEDWDDADALLADLAKAGFKVTAYEDSSSDDPFAYDFLDVDQETTWEGRLEAPESVGRVSPQPEVARPAAEAAVPAIEPGGVLAAHGAPAIEPRSAPGEPAVATPGPPGVPPPGSAGMRPAVTPAAPPSGTPGTPDTSPDAPPSSDADEPAQAPLARLHRRHAAPRVVRPSRNPRPEVAEDATRVPATRNPVVATLTGMALAGVLLLCFFAGPPAVLAAVTVAVTLAAAELYNSLRISGYRPATLLGLLAVPGVIVAAYFCGPQAIVVAVVIFVVLTMIWYLLGFTRRSPVASLSVTVFAFCWTGVLGAFAGLLVDPRIFPHRHGIAFLLGAIIAAVGYDVGGYAIGSRLGRHNLVPSVSPNKSWEGLIGGCLVAIAASVAVTSHIHPWTIHSSLVLGLIVAVVAPFGDLVESMVKRDLGVKDMGSILPGHGGMLDRIDALLFVMPAAYFFIRLAHIG